jgi:hypothetical protein
MSKGCKKRWSCGDCVQEIQPTDQELEDEKRLDELVRGSGSDVKIAITAAREGGREGGRPGATPRGRDAARVAADRQQPPVVDASRKVGGQSRDDHVACM